MYVDYDDKFDVLYVRWGVCTNAYGTEEVESCTLMKDIESDEVVGINIMNVRGMINGNHM